MKKIFCIGLIMFFGTCVLAFSQKTSHKLVGIWQFCNEMKKSDGEKVLAFSPIWKVLYSDGSFSQFMLMYKDGGCALTHEGTYEVLSDDTYTEFISQHAVDKDLIGKKTELTYHFLNEDMVAFTYKLYGRNDEFHELWKRVKLYSPTKSK